MPMNILYQDKYLVVAVKPVGVLSEDDPKAACMPALLREHYRALGEKDYIATVHRLDRVTGGVMVFSRRKEITGKLTAAVAAHQITKEYLAVLRGHPEKDSDTLTDLLFRDAAHNKSYVVQRMRKGVREATLDYTVLDKTDALTLVKVRLHTGRTHQIRVQFSHRGLPLLGDIRYGSKADCSAALWSYRLAFTHPVTGEAVDVTCPPPCEFPWDQFNIKKRNDKGHSAFIYSAFFSASVNALASWSGQEVGFPPQEMPCIRSMASVAFMPTTSREMPCKLPLHPPSTFTSLMTPSSSSTVMRREQTPRGVNV